MEFLLDDEKISIQFIVLAPLISLIMPFIGAILDRESKCCLVPLIEYGNLVVQIATVVYFALPLSAGIYGLIKLIRSEKLYLLNKKKFYLLSGLTTFNILLPFLLYYWFLASIILLFGLGCYEFKIKF